MSKNKDYVRFVEVFGFNGLPYRDYNSQVKSAREIYLFLIQINDFHLAVNSRCYLEEKELTVLEHSTILGDEIIQLCTNWLRTN